MKLRSIATGIIAAVLVGAVALPASATTPQAQTTPSKIKIVGGPLTSLAFAGDQIHLTIKGLPKNTGVYVRECLATPKRPTAAQCNGNGVWVTPAFPGGMYPTDGTVGKPNTDFVLPVAGAFGAVDCSVSKCVIFVQRDHLGPTDKSLDTIVKISFARRLASSTPSATATPAAIGPDALTTTIGSATLGDAPTPIDASVSQTIVVKTLSGATPTIVALPGGNCIITGNMVAPGWSGYCVVQVTSAGNSSYTKVSKVYPLSVAKAAAAPAAMGPDVLTTTIGSATLGDAPTAINASVDQTIVVKTLSGATPTIVALSGGNCVITGTTIAAGWSGYCVVQVTSAGNSSYTKVSKVYPLSVAK